MTPRMMTASLCLAIFANLSHGQVAGRWTFNDKGVVTEAGSLTGRVVGGAKWHDGPPGAFGFDGDKQAGTRIVLADEIAAAKLPGRAITVEAWVMVNEPQEWGGFVSAVQDNGDFERGWVLGFNGEHFSFGLASEKVRRLTYVKSPQYFEPGQWYHVAGTYDGRVMRLYVDGKLHASDESQGGAIAYAPTGPVVLGAYQDDNELYPLNGRMEQASIWGEPLTAGQVKARFDERKGRFPGIEPVKPRVTDWPTYLRDNERTGLADEALQFPMRLRWVHEARHAPTPAWPPPAKKDYWNRRDHHPRVIFDRAHHVVGVGGAVYFGTSADDRVVCLDLDTGQERWSHYLEGPVRLAPTVADGRVLAGCDDGYVYCLRAEDGRLIWRYRLGPEERRIAGNGRVMSLWPVRSGVMAEGDRAMFCAGLFPSQGTFQAAVSVLSGQPLATGAIDTSPQGYMKMRGSRLYVGAGRAQDAFVSKLERRGKSFGEQANTIAERYPYAFVGAGASRIGGGDDEVAAFDETTAQLLWHAAVEGRAYGLAVMDGRLLVSTDRGLIYCFESGEAKPDDGRRIKAVKREAYPYGNDAERSRHERAAQRIVERAAVKRGYALVLGGETGPLAYELARRTEWQIVAIERDAAKAAAARRTLGELGLYGVRIAVHHVEPDRSLPYTDYMFNIVAMDGPPGVARGEIERVLRPGDGLAFIDGPEGEPLRRPALQGVGEWTHMYGDAANTACSGDTHVAGAMTVQWFGEPGPRDMIDRHHRTIAPLSVGGRLFIGGEDRVIGVDGYNGTVLWNIAAPDSRRIGVMRDSSYLAAAADLVYVAAGDRCMALDAATGEPRSEWSVPAAADGGKRQWGHVAVVGDTLFGSRARHGASRRDQSREAIEEGTYFDARPIVCSELLFASPRHGGATTWTYQPNAGAILNPTITIGDGRVWFIESDNAATLTTPNGRNTPAALLSDGASLVSLDAATGKPLWRKPIDALKRIEHHVFVAYARGQVVVVGSRNGQKTVWYDIHAFDAATGEKKWSRSQDNQTVVNGDHGEQDHHPVIVGEVLCVEPFAYDFMTGQPVKDWRWTPKHRRGCGTISASASAFFFREQNPTMFDLTTGTYSKLTTVTRPGCWINLIPAGGLLLAPEASSGCSCDFSVQTSMAFIPRATEPKPKSKP